MKKSKKSFGKRLIKNLKEMIDCVKSEHPLEEKLNITTVVKNKDGSYTFTQMQVGSPTFP